MGMPRVPPPYTPFAKPVVQASAVRTFPKPPAMVNTRPVPAVPPPVARPPQVPPAQLQPPQRPTAGLVQLLQMSRRGRQKKNDDDDDYVPPGANRQLRFTFPVSLRSRIIRRTAVLHVRGYYACPRCGRPMARRDRTELPFYYRSKKKNRLHKTSS